MQCLLSIACSRPTSYSTYCPYFALLLTGFFWTLRPLNSARRKSRRSCTMGVKYLVSVLADRCCLVTRPATSLLFCSAMLSVSIGFCRYPRGDQVRCQSQKFAGKNNIFREFQRRIIELLIVCYNDKCLIAWISKPWTYKVLVHKT